MKYTNNRKNCFTLIELLIVISILMLLAGLLLPAVNAAIRRARQAQSSINLSNIYTAYMSRRKDQSVVLRLGHTPAEGWAGTLLPYVNYNKKVFLAPGSYEGHYAGIDGCVVLVDDQNRVQARAPFAPGFWNLRGSFREVNRDDLGHLIEEVEDRLYSAAARYTDGSPGDGESFEISFYTHGSAGAHVHIDRFRIFPGTGMLEAEEIDNIRLNRASIVDSKGYEELVPPFGSDGNSWSADWSARMVDRCSYGMNDLFDTDYLDIPMRDTILIMEFMHRRIEVSSTNEIPWDDYVLRGFRGNSLALFADGSVRPVDPDEVDPNEEDNWNLYWNPYYQD